MDGGHPGAPADSRLRPTAAGARQAGPGRESGRLPERNWRGIRNGAGQRFLHAGVPVSPDADDAGRHPSDGGAAGGHAEEAARVGNLGPS